MRGRAKRQAPILSLSTHGCSLCLLFTHLLLHFPLPPQAATMKSQAVVVKEVNGSWDIDDVEIGDPEANEVLVAIQASGACHSDLSLHNGVRLLDPARLSARPLFIADCQCTDYSLRVPSRVRSRGCRNGRQGRIRRQARQGWGQGRWRSTVARSGAYSLLAQVCLSWAFCRNVKTLDVSLSSSLMTIE